MQFEFDEVKSKKNKKKHGIDFIEAQQLWEDPDSIGFPAKSDDEKRFALIARIGTKIWAAFYTLRDSRTRIISVRRARVGEKKLYES